MAIENSVSNDFRSMIVGSINVFDCRLSFVLTVDSLNVGLKLSYSLRAQLSTFLFYVLKFCLTVFICVGVQNMIFIFWF